MLPRLPVPVQDQRCASGRSGHPGIGRRPPADRAETVLLLTHRASAADRFPFATYDTPASTGHVISPEQKCVIADILPSWAADLLTLMQVPKIRSSTEREILSRIDLPSDQLQLFDTYGVTDAETIDTSATGKLFRPQPA
jgi:hypothetical protein